MEHMVKMLVDRPLSEAEWEALADPDGGRYEVLDGRVIMSPSPNADHNRYSEELADILREALRQSGRDLPVTMDVEWRTIAGDVVAQAPRGDIVVGRSLDPERRIHNDVPLLVVEVWSHLTSPGIRSGRRAYWASVGLRHYWDVLLGSAHDDTTLEVWDLIDGAAFPGARAAGADTVRVAEPFAVEITPAHIHGWTQRQTERVERLAARLREHGLNDE